MAIEQAPVKSAKSRPEMAVVTIKKSGDEGIDVGLIDHYVSLGYQFKEQSPSGSVMMEMPKDSANARYQASMDEHFRRAKGAERASLGPEIKLVEDRSETLNPKSAQDLIGTMKLDNEPEF